MEEKGVWRTIGGRRVFIKEGQSLSDAMKESGKFNSKETIKEGINKTLNSMSVQELEKAKNNAKDEKTKKIYENEINKRNNENSTKKILYHQTKANNLDEFDESKRQAGLSDTSTPKGIFLKETDEDIGLEGKKQLKMEVTMEKPLTIKNREELQRIVKLENENYKKIMDKEFDSDKYYDSKNIEIETQIDDIYEKEYYEKNQIQKKEYQKQRIDLERKQTELLNEWKNADKNNGKIAQEEITKTLKGLGYDSVILEEDEGGFGRKIKSYIVFDIKQLKQVK
jgi:hypothetical protein